ncbi:hypothetical protein SS50377_24956 [Spironucleus salmonicida]|uniref:Uncharacterized protein n=1 Tax=Spironucleus salmonicida TaxID=348837 RepID=A0A9P8RXT6_9EUKA|nr:hypothetical protein SS50377_24956 [Spironucleus salmonicida]
MKDQMGAGIQAIEKQAIASLTKADIRPQCIQNTAIIPANDNLSYQLNNYSSHSLLSAKTSLLNSKNKLDSIIYSLMTENEDILIDLRVEQ